MSAFTRFRVCIIIKVHTCNSRDYLSDCRGALSKARWHRSLPIIAANLKSIDGTCARDMYNKAKHGCRSNLPVSTVNLGLLDSCICATVGKYLRRCLSHTSDICHRARDTHDVASHDKYQIRVTEAVPINSKPRNLSSKPHQTLYRVR